jgi:hypothetical protein
MRLLGNITISNNYWKRSCFNPPSYSYPKHIYSIDRVRPSSDKSEEKDA